MTTPDGVPETSPADHLTTLKRLLREKALISGELTDSSQAQAYGPPTGLGKVYIDKTPSDIDLEISRTHAYLQKLERDRVSTEAMERWNSKVAEILALLEEIEQGKS